MKDKSPLTLQNAAIGVAALLAALGTIGTALNFGFIVLHNREHLEDTRRELCDRPLTGDPEKDDPLRAARSAMGGCT